MFGKLKRILKKNGFFGGIKYIISKLTGRAALVESVDTLYYFLEKCVDIKTFPKATGSLRDLQECDVALLKVFDLACRKNNLTYWMDWGTLLGAVRHGGFIPWDDDMDVSMPREDYDRALEILPKEFAELGIDVGEFSFKPLASFGFSIKHRQTGIWLDVFPVDEYYCKDEQDIAVLKKKIGKYQKFYKKKKLKKSKQQLLDKKNALLADFLTKTDERCNAILCHNIEFLDPKLNVHYASDVFPLGAVEFDGCSFAAPKNPDAFLRAEYGNNYMSFPKSGAEHHGDDAGKLKNWAAANNINMKDVLAELEGIADAYEGRNA